MTDIRKHLHLPDQRPDLTEALKVRIDADLAHDLDVLEAIFRGRGHRDVNRSTLVRAALSEYLQGVAEALPAREAKKMLVSNAKART